MDHEERPPAFPYHVICDEYGPSHLVTWERLQQNAEHYSRLFGLGVRELQTFRTTPGDAQGYDGALAAQAIEEETGEPIAMSPGNKVDPAPHLINAGDRLVLHLFKLTESKTDEQLVVESHERGGKRAESRKNSR